MGSGQYREFFCVDLCLRGGIVSRSTYRCVIDQVVNLLCNFNRKPDPGCCHVFLKMGDTGGAGNNVYVPGLL